MRVKSEYTNTKELELWLENLLKVPDNDDTAAISAPQLLGLIEEILKNRREK